MAPSGALINIFACMSVGRHGVATSRTGTLVAAGDVDTLEGTEVANALGALVDVVTGVSVLFQVEALATVALVRAKDVSTFLTAGVLVTLVQIFTVFAIKGQGEARGAGTVVGAWGVLTGLGTQSPWVAPALIHVGAHLAGGVVLVACLTVTAVATGEVVTDLALYTAVGPCLALIHVYAFGSVRT